MMQSLRWRIAVCVAVFLATLVLLYPTVGPVSAPWNRYLQPIRLGLDLQGGLHLILEVQTKEAIKAVVDQTMAAVQDDMKKFSIRYRDVYRKSDTSFAVVLKNAAQEPIFDAKVAQALGNFRKVSSSETKKGFEVDLAISPVNATDIEKQAVRQAVDTIRNRVDALGVAEPDVILQGDDRIIVQLPGLREDTNRAIDIIKKTARLEFRIVNEKGSLDAALKGNVPKDSQVLYEIDRDPVTGSVSRRAWLVYKQVLMTGDTITSAKPVPTNTGGFEISLKFNGRGADLFYRITSSHVHDKLAIVLDNRVYSAPEIQEPIPGGQARITGRFSPQEASDLALVLRSGSLPAPVKILETRAVGPSLGADSIRLGRNAVALGLLLVVICMALYYKWSGLVADVALVLNLMLIFAVMASPALRATLTLPGLAGVALTMGMAIDANVLIFERIREELRKGKSPKAALEIGYQRAFWTIFDSNLTTILAALPLIQFGTGPIKGFAVTLCIGLIISMFTALFVTRTIFDYAFANMRMKRLSI